MYQTHSPPAGQSGDHSHPDRQVQSGPVQLVLEHTLSIMKATTEAQLVARTLAASCAVTGGSVAVAFDRDGTRWIHGDQDTALRLVSAGRAALMGRVGGVSTAFTGIGLPSAISVAFGEAVLLVASAERGNLGSEEGSLLALLVAHAQSARERLRELDQLSRRANRDPLTGLRHYRPFEERLCVSSPGRTAVIAVDVDDFKKINDEYGHQAGDDALLSLVGALRAALRGDDQLYRIGGDEFAVVVDVNGAGEVETITRRLLEAARRIGQSISVGAALHVPGETGRETLLRADRALYDAKRAGRNTARLAA